MHQAKILRNTVVLCSLLLLAGCATTPSNCDPSNINASLITKMNCDHSGSYAARVHQRERDLIAAREENAAFRQVYENLQAQQQATQLSLAEQRSHQDQLNSSLDRLLSQLRTRHTDKMDVQQQIEALQQQLETEQKRMQNADPATLQARQQELKNLHQKVSTLQFSLGYE